VVQTLVRGLCYELYSLVYTVFVYCAYDILFLVHLVYLLESVVRCTLSIARSGGWPGIAAVTAGVLSGRVGGVDVA